MIKKTKEKQYDILFKTEKKHGRTSFGIMANESWNQDPKRTLFTLSRYKFVAKLLEGKKEVLEIGCADAFGTRIVQQHVDKVTAIDFDPIFINDVESRMNPHWPMNVFLHDILKSPIKKKFDSIFMLDVLEHIDKKLERKFLINSLFSLKKNGSMIIGILSLESQKYASPQSKKGHVNCKSAPDLKRLMEVFFSNVFIFSMNDEVVHTGFHKMANYIFALCANRK